MGDIVVRNKSTGLPEIPNTFDKLFGRDVFEDGLKFPKIDISEDKDKFILKAEVPTIEEEDLKVSIKGNTLTIRGESRREKEIREEDYYSYSSSYGSFSRDIPLPKNVKKNGIKTSFKDGVLAVDLPKLRVK